MKHCEDFAEASEGCCDSCHDDYDLAGMPLIEYYAAWDGFDAQVCCAVARSLDKE